MIGEFVLPSSLIIMKFGLRLFLDQEVKTVDLMRAFIMFPVDLAFLAFSFAAASMLAAAHYASGSIDLKTMLAFMFACVALSFIVIVCCKKSDRAFVIEKNGIAIAFLAPAYVLAITTVIASFSAGIVI